MIINYSILHLISYYWTKKRCTLDRKLVVLVIHISTVKGLNDGYVCVNDQAVYVNIFAAIIWPNLID